LRRRIEAAGCTDAGLANARGKPDMARYLGGSDVGFELPGFGVFVAPNLTRIRSPDWANGPRRRS
jgi:hypothetical protein